MNGRDLRVQTEQAGADVLHVGHRTWNSLRRDGALQLTRRRVGATVLKGVGAGVAFLLIGNLAILAASLWARGTTKVTAVAPIEGIDNLAAVDDKVWRGAAPTTDGYRGLAQAGISTVVDLRAEEGVEHDVQVVTDHGMRMVRLPVRDGQTPSMQEIETFLGAVRESDGRVFVHCGAGVGRTGAMVGAYQVAQGELGAASALRRNLAIGPPSLEQIAFVAAMDPDRLEKPSPMLTAVSRVLDAPRRIWSRYGL